MEITTITHRLSAVCTDRLFLEPRRQRRYWGFTFFLLVLCHSGLAQPHDYLAAPIDGRRTVSLAGSRNPRIRTMADEGPVDDSTRVQGIHFRFKPSAEQSAELAQLLEDQQNPS